MSLGEQPDHAANPECIHAGPLLAERLIQQRVPKRFLVERCRGQQPVLGHRIAVEFLVGQPRFRWGAG